MSQSEDMPMQQDPVESGALEEEDEGGAGQAQPQQDQPTESGALEEGQRGKGYGGDEGEREQSLPGG